MYIKSMVIDGFKSYCQRTEITGFDLQFNAITGLNGSGKSNILDAICFLLGITNLSHVRASNLQELVYKSGQAGITKATVSIVFDNTDKNSSPYGYEQFDELTITRQIAVGGRNKYLINGTNATNSRVQDLFHSVQLNVNNPHFLIMQGRITKVLNMKPPEILSLLEEAASTKLYENKKEAALKTIEKKDSKLREIDRVVQEDINPTIRKLREERTSYLEFQKVTRTIEHLTRLTTAYDFTRLEAIKQRSKDNLVKLEHQLTESREGLEKLKKEKAEMDEKIVALTEERQNLLGAALEAAENETTERRKVEAVAAGAANRAAEQLRAARKHLRSAEAAAAELAKQLEEKRRAAGDAAGTAFCALEEAAQRAKEALSEAQANLAATKSGLGGGGGSKLAGGLAEQARVAQGARVAVETELKQLEMRATHLARELAAGEKQLAAMEWRAGPGGKASAELKRREDLLHQMDGVNAQLAEIAKADEAAGGDEATLNEKYNELAREARGLQACSDELGRQCHQLQFEYTDPEPNFDRRRVYGVVAKLFDLVDPKYATAIEVAAGSKLFNVVVDTETTGKALMERGQLARRVTMLPLNRMRGSTIAPEVLRRAQAAVGDGGEVAPALSLIRYPPHLAPVMEFVFGGLLVCPTLDQARVVAFHPGVEKRTITYEGDTFDPQGTLSGGSRGGGAGGPSLLIRVAELRKAEMAAAEAWSRARAAQAACQAAVERARQRADLAEALDRARHQLALIETNLRQSDTHRLRSDLERQRKELAEVREAQKLGKERLVEAEKAASEAQWRVDHAQEEEARAVRSGEEAVRTAREAAEAAETALADAQRRKETLRLEAAELEREAAASASAAETARSDLAAAEAAMETTRAAAAEAREQLAEARAALAEQQRRVDAAAGAIQAAKGEAEALKARINETSCAIDQLAHDLDVYEKESREAAAKLAKMLEANAWIEEEREQFGAANGPFDFAKHGATNGEAQKRLLSLTERRDKLARTVNMRAMNMLGSAEEKYTDLLRRREIVLADKSKIQRFIDELDEHKEEVLLEAYKKVNQEFNNIFSSLLPGTRAELVPLEGQTIMEGLQFRVAFGDTWKESLSELSGGQRSLVALALILALLLFKPAPIYILDEVDAALDLSHTQNIGQLIKNHFKKAQFIVVSLKDGMFNNANVLFKTKFVDGVSTVTRHTPALSGAAAGSSNTVKGDSRPHQIGGRRKLVS